MFSKRKLMLISLAVMFVLFAAGCKKKAPAPPPPPPPPPPTAPAPPPPPAAPRITSFTAEPASIQRGESSTLRWEVTGQANNISIDQGIGTVQATGNRRVFPTNSTTYTLTAAGPGGNTTARATIAVTAPPPPPPPPPPPAVTKRAFPDVLSSEVQDAFFDYDKSDIRPDARDALTRNAAALKSLLADYPNATVMVEGHCDERGSAEYNLGLGDRRATAAKDFLVQLGVPADRLKTISYGKERPVCTEHEESCWQRNRRAHFSPGQ
jgi:peptidoglycan-associated lipoprotein